MLIKTSPLPLLFCFYIALNWHILEYLHSALLLFKWATVLSLKQLGLVNCYNEVKSGDLWNTVEALLNDSSEAGVVKKIFEALASFRERVFQQSENWYNTILDLEAPSLCIYIHTVSASGC